MTLVRMALLVGSVFIGLLSMHVLLAPATQPQSVPATSHEQIGAHHGARASADAKSVPERSHGCADCPMDHDLAAVGCVLALLALLLLVRPPKVLGISAVVESIYRPVNATSRVWATRPDLTALGICRT